MVAATKFQLCAVCFTTLVFICLTACKKNVDDLLGIGQIRAVNTVNSSSPQHFYQDQTKLSVNSLAYGQASEHLAVKSGVSEYFFKNADDNKVNATSKGNINKGDSYTAFYYTNLQGSAAFKAIQNDDLPAASGKVKIRFVNFGAAFLNNLNIGLAGGSALVTGLAVFNYSNYLTIDANTSLSVKVVGATTEVTIPANAFLAGRFISSGSTQPPVARQNTTLLIKTKVGNNSAISVYFRQTSIF